MQLSLNFFLASSFYPHHNADTFPLPSPNPVGDGNQVDDPPSDAETEDGWFDDLELQEVKRSGSNILEASSPEVIRRDFVCFQHINMF